MSRKYGFRLCLLLTFLAPALIAMHSLVASVPASSHEHASADSCHHEMPCEEVHSGTHACVGVLGTAVAAYPDDSMLGDSPSLDLLHHESLVRHVDGRWPPWTTPTSADLSIWRV